ncbi:putative RING-H2 finger protein ATL69 [Panicum miliaceum]|uniref:RING-H2 finger protein ATL69 n=1 Tax=Panicum miliaceum TaxID=4540 RepID=A0A3L6R7X4_PANMI|nr:putative RING-H2 finger protein ATL69 [Panicum miliaceum]
MSAYLRASAIATAASGVGLGYGIAIAVGVLILVSTVMLISYLCVLTKAGAAHAATLLAAPAAPSPAAAAAVLGLDVAAIDAMYPKYPHVAGTGDDGDGGGGPCAICLGDFARGDALRRGPGCGHRFHACCAERWLRVSATCPVCRDSPVATPLAEAVPLAAHAR